MARYTRQAIRRRALNHQLCGVFTPKDEFLKLVNIFFMKMFSTFVLFSPDTQFVTHLHQGFPPVQQSSIVFPLPESSSKSFVNCATAASIAAFFHKTVDDIW